MSEEKRDPTTPKSGDKPQEPSSNPEGTGQSSSSPTSPSSGNEDRVKELETEVEELKTKYSESSTEGKRLKKELDSGDESREEKDEYIEALEKSLDDIKEKGEKKAEKEKEEKEEEEKKKNAEKIVKPEPVKPEPGKDLPPFMTKEGQERAIKKVLATEKEKTDEADKQYKAALEKHPRLENSGYAKLVSSKMKSLGIAVKEACEEVDKDLGSLGNEPEGEPFVEGGTGKTTPQTNQSPEDEIRESLRNQRTNSDLPGMV